MFDLTRQEKIILIFLCAAFMLGLAVNIYKKAGSRIELTIGSPRIEELRRSSECMIAQNKIIDINSSGIEGLRRLPGIGEKIAAEIITYRKEKGPFRYKNELLQIKGIGKEKFEKIKDLIVLK